MNIQTIKTCRVTTPQNLNIFSDTYLPTLEENTVVAVTSKIVSLCEGRTVAMGNCSKTMLIQQEADRVIFDNSSNTHIVLTYKNNMLIPAAGIDESNSDGQYILYPQNPFLSAKNLCEYLKQKRKIEHLGILITDSHTTPLRRGVTGIALAWWGFQPTHNLIGQPDLFGRPLQFTHINVADALAASAVYNMGECSECTPLAILTNIPNITFDQSTHSIEEISIEPEQDIYRPLLQPLLQSTSPIKQTH